MQPQAIIFIGRSGCGKGTQSKLLIEYLAKTDPARASLYVQCGNEFRTFIKGESVTQKRTAALYDKGVLMPEFLAIYMWVNVLTTQYTGEQYLIIDGTPRKPHEATVLDSAFGFYGIAKPIVVHIDVSEQWSTEHLAARKRLDDTADEIAQRLEWYQTDVVPTIEFYKNNPKYTFIRIDGEKPIADVHTSLVAQLGWQ